MDRFKYCSQNRFLRGHSIQKTHVDCKQLCALSRRGALYSVNLKRVHLQLCFCGYGPYIHQLDWIKTPPPHSFIEPDEVNKCVKVLCSFYLNPLCTQQHIVLYWPHIKTAFGRCKDSVIFHSLWVVCYFSHLITRSLFYNPATTTVWFWLLNKSIIYNGCQSSAYN